MGRSKVELFEEIRRDHGEGGISIRGLADRHGVHRRTVRQALASAVPPERKAATRAAPALDRWKPAIDAMLREDLDAPRKQRHTAKRVFDRLVDEHEASVSYSTVRAYVHDRRPQIDAEAGRRVAEAFIAQEHAPGREAEVDFADIWVILGGVKTKLYLFTLRLSCSGKAVHRAFATGSQESFLEGHRIAFEVLGGVPMGQVRYDNLKAAVTRILLGRARAESDRWVAFRSHYGFDSFYCLPGKEGAHEKGGVEGEGGRFRRNHLVPMPRVASIAELNDLLAAADAADDDRRIGLRTATVGEAFAAEAPFLKPLPADGFETGLELTPRVDRHARITVRQVQYSVPAQLIGRRVRVLLRAVEVIVFDGARQVAVHERSHVRGSMHLVLDHYLEVLARKPGALPGSTALAQARASGAFTPAHQRWWDAARARHGDTAGTQSLVEVLLLHRHLPAGAVAAGIAAALEVGALSADIVAIEARKAAAATPAPTHEVVRRPLAPVVPLPARPTEPIPDDDRPAPSVAHYDQLLTQPKESTA